MASLKFKDENGKWVGIASLKGDPGPQGKQGIQGIQGIRGIPGQNGLNGKDGITPTFEIGTVTTGAANVSMTEVDNHYTLNFTLPNGADKEYTEGLIDIVYPIGSYYETSDASFNPNNSWGGTWELEEDGTVLVSKSNVEDSKFNNVLGTVLGEESVQLQFTDYQHFLYNCYVGNPDNDIVRYVDFTGGGYGFGAQYDGNKNTPHNNIQPSKIVNRWHRIG